ncbi:unnamed protein product [Linum tenue]|uniref:SET domain-containing protein n=1 Tax=Linum tenue TaxID=586396 RepID=A0AAV0IF71_9ROSI|nr:unnamed protein product [Linum tenue]
MAEMEMRAREDVEIGRDITPAIPPISFSLHDAFLHSHCSACFSPLSGRPFPPRHHRHLSSSSSVLYCSPLCSAADSPLHFSSAESNLLDSSPPSPSSESSADLRLLRTSSAAASGDRMFGLLTNREKLLAEGDEISDRVRSGAAAMAAARGRGNGAAEEEESAICLVITNGVEVVDEKGRGIGIAVYDSAFSWINHSCSPNACYRFLLPSPDLSPSPPDSDLRIVPSGPTVENAASAGGGGYGPRIVVRSIRRIKKGEEITVAYTDLLQPKAARSSELWSKYRFICCCKRCSSSSSSSYVDRALEEIATSQGFDNVEATGRRLTDYVDEVITDFLSDDGDPETCCRKLEHLLVSGLSGLRLHPLHHLAINAYTTLSSAYRIHASTSSLTSDHHHCPESFSKTRTSAAYALFLAAAANHLLTFEPSLVACVANYWASAGECLLTLSSSSSPPPPPSRVAQQYRCSKCSFVDALKAVSYADFETVKCKLVDCIGGYTRRSWGYLSKGCDYLERFEDPMDLSWVQKWPASSNRDAKCGFVVAESMDDVWQLGAHCLAYGGFLAAVCYGGAIALE